MREGKCRLVYVRFAPPHGLARRVPDAVLAGTGTLCRWMIGFMRRREILRLPVSAQGKEAAVRLHYRSDFFVGVQWLVVSFSQKRFSLQMITHLKKAHPVAYG